MSPGDIAAILVRMDHQDEVLGEIAEQARKTNGRVTKLEMESAVAKALAEQKAREKQAHAWIAPAVAGGACTLVGAALAVLFG